ncbi:ABC transporter permease [Phycisphaeraceae bacterium D3-23]
MRLQGLYRILGITLLLLVVCVVTMAINPAAAKTNNLDNLLHWTALFGILTLGVAFVIITGGIDLSIGSVVALTGVVLAVLLTIHYEPTDHQVTVTTIDGDEGRLVLSGLPPGFTLRDQVEFKDPTSSPPNEPRSIRIDAELTSLDNTDGVVFVEGSTRWLSEGDRGVVMEARSWSAWAAVPLVLLIAAGIGLFHGLLITKMNLQPFVVTLCGLLIYRGLSRYFAGDQSQNLTDAPEGLKALNSGDPFSIPIPFINWIGEGRWGRVAVDSSGVQKMNRAGEVMLGGDGKPVRDAAGEMMMNPAGIAESPVALDLVGWVPMPMPMLILLGLAVLSALFLHRTVWGRYLFALGRNEEATRFSGIDTDRMVILSYILCSLMAGLGGILIGLHINSLQPAGHGNFYELYAIAAAVLGGCSLRGGVGSVAGVIIGTAVLRALYNAINMLGIPTYLEYAIIGGVLLVGVMADEVVRKAIGAVQARKRRAQALG